MTYYDKHLRDSLSTDEGQPRRRRMMLAGAASITLWPRLNAVGVADVGDDWAAVGNDLRDAMNDFGSQHG